MVKQQRRADRCFAAAAVSNGVTQVQFPVGLIQRKHLLTQQSSATGSSSTTEEERGQQAGGGTKRARLDGAEEAAAVTSRERVPGSCGQPGGESGSTADGVSCGRPPQQGSAEVSEDSQATELQGVRSLKVTIQQSSESREFGQTDRTAERQMGGLHCHVCELTCRSLQVFQEHMTGSEHLRKLKEMTHSINLNTHTLQDRGRRPDAQRWCDTCQTHFSGDVIVHRRTKQHKACKQLSRPFCPVCKRHFRTPRKFVEHMKSAEHKEQVHLQEVQEEELITVDAVGCFEEEEEKEEQEEEQEEEEEKEEQEEEREEVDVADEEEGDGGEEGAEEVLEVRSDVEVADRQETDSERFDPHTIYGSSFVLPVSGFLCRLCNKFFYRETTARHTHCRTHTHYLNLQRRLSQERRDDQDRSALTSDL